MTSEGFTKLYELPADETNKIVADDTTLMQFGFRFLRQVLFGENSITLKRVAAEKRREQVQQRSRQIEREAEEKLSLRNRMTCMVIRLPRRGAAANSQVG